MVESKAVYQGQLRCQAVHVPSGSLLETDAPVDNNGKGERFSPTDLVAVALGTCMMTIMGIIGERQGIVLEGLQVSVFKEMSTEPPRRIGKLTVHFTMPRGLTYEHRNLLENAAITCPVHKSLNPEIEMRIDFVYPD